MLFSFLVWRQESLNLCHERVKVGLLFQIAIASGRQRCLTVAAIA